MTLMTDRSFGEFAIVYRMKTVPDTTTDAPQTYMTEYMSAVDRTESLGITPPRRVIVKKPCVNQELTGSVILDYFDRHTPEDLKGQTLAINADLVYLLWHKTHVPFEITFGVVDFKGKRYGEFSENIIHRYLTDKQVAWMRDGVLCHVWLTSPALEVLDITWAMNLGFCTTRAQCSRSILYKALNISHNEPPIYHPMIVGEDFLYKTGCVIEFGDQK